jgi:hypothetical protein
MGFPLRRADGAMFRGWVKVTKADVSEGYRFCATVRPLSAAPGGSSWSWHGRSRGKLKRLDPAGRGFGDPGQDRERRLAAELNRHKGQLLLRHSEAAEELFRKTLSIVD